MTNRIGSFQGEYRFLSNFYPAKLFLDGEIYPTLEHAFQASKTTDPLERMVIQAMETPGMARAAGRSVVVMRHLRPDWDKVRVDVMHELLFQKFLDPDLRGKLLGTGDAELVEGNTWNDTFWGVCGGVGENMLGILLMVVREDLKDYVRRVGG